MKIQLVARLHFLAVFAYLAENNANPIGIPKGVRNAPRRVE